MVNQWDVCLCGRKGHNCEITTKYFIYILKVQKAENFDLVYILA